MWCEKVYLDTCKPIGKWMKPVHEGATGRKRKGKDLKDIPAGRR
jgi:hypothetical protein